jgi:hypothetical protein
MCCKAKDGHVYAKDFKYVEWSIAIGTYKKT